MSTTATKSKPSRTSKSKAAGRTGKGSKSKGAAAKSKRASANPKTASAKTDNNDGGKRLSPGALDGLVLGCMKRNPKKLPATSGVVGRGIKRSPGAIASEARDARRGGTRQPFSFTPPAFCSAWASPPLRRRASGALFACWVSG
jgi:hypothetical protein